MDQAVQLAIRTLQNPDAWRERYGALIDLHRATESLLEENERLHRADAEMRAEFRESLLATKEDRKELARVVAADEATLWGIREHVTAHAPELLLLAPPVRLRLPVPPLAELERLARQMEELESKLRVKESQQAGAVVAAAEQRPKEAATEVSLTELEFKVLQHLAESKFLVKQPDIAAAVDFCERSVRTALNKLKASGLVELPKGNKSGYGITAQGRTRLNTPG